MSFVFFLRLCSYCSKYGSLHCYPLQAFSNHCSSFYWWNCPRCCRWSVSAVLQSMLVLILKHIYQARLQVVPRSFAWSNINRMEKSDRKWPRHFQIEPPLLSGFHAAIAFFWLFFSQFSFTSRMTDLAKEGLYLLVVYSTTTLVETKRRSLSSGFNFSCLFLSPTFV